MAPLLPRLRADEDGARVRAVGTRGAGKPCERDGELDPRRRENDVARASDDGIRPLERGAIGELDRYDEVTLVLRGNEPRGDGPEPDHDETEQESIGGERERGSAYQSPDRSSIAMAGPLENPVERPEEPPEQAVPKPSEPVL